MCGWVENTRISAAAIAVMVVVRVSHNTSKYIYIYIYTRRHRTVYMTGSGELLLLYASEDNYGAFPKVRSCCSWGSTCGGGVCG